METCSSCSTKIPIQIGYCFNCGAPTMMNFLKFACIPSLGYYREGIQQAKNIRNLNLFAAFYQVQASEKTATAMAVDEEFLGLDQPIGAESRAAESNLESPADLDDETYLQLGIPDEEQLKNLEKQLMGEDQEYLAIEGKPGTPLPPAETRPRLDSGFMALPPKPPAPQQQQTPPRLDSGVLALPIKKSTAAKDKPPAIESGIIAMTASKPVDKTDEAEVAVPASAAAKLADAPRVVKVKLSPLLSTETKKKILGRVQRYAPADEEMQSAQIRKAVKILQKIQSEDIAADEKAAIVTRKAIDSSSQEQAPLEIVYTDVLPETFDYLQFTLQDSSPEKGYQVLGISASHDHDFLVFPSASPPASANRSSIPLWLLIAFAIILILGIVLGVAISRWAY